MGDQTKKGKILFICGSMNQTTMMHEISKHLEDYEHYFTSYYADGFIDKLAQAGFLDFSILGGEFRRNTENYLNENNLNIDYQGVSHHYDLVLTCSDLIVPKNIQNTRLILVQEGMTDPKTIGFYTSKWLNTPRYLAGTSATGLSNSFDKFCVASYGYRDLFVENGVEPDKIEVTGIPNYDNCEKYYDNDFPHKNYVLVATSDSRETFKYENRKKFIKYCRKIANGKKLIFKLHPNEEKKRAIAEINKYAPEALVYAEGNAHEMIANCDVFIAKYSTLVYTALALGKEAYSFFDIEELKSLSPIQNGGRSARNIAGVCRNLLNNKANRKEKATNSYAVKKIKLSMEKIKNLNKIMKERILS